MQLLQLPRELRDIIYAYSVTSGTDDADADAHDVALNLPSKNGQTGTRPGSCNSRTPRGWFMHGCKHHTDHNSDFLPAICLVNAQLYQEATLSFLQIRKSFNLIDIEHVEDFRQFVSGIDRGFEHVQALQLFHYDPTLGDTALLDLLSLSENLRSLTLITSYCCLPARLPWPAVNPNVDGWPTRYKPLLRDVERFRVLESAKRLGRFEWVQPGRLKGSKELYSLAKTGLQELLGPGVEVCVTRRDEWELLH
jgi:hypothetical protein